MRYLLIAVLFAASGAAHGQANLTGQALPIPPADQNPKNFNERIRPDRECLINKATGQRVCHSRPGWEAIARKVGSDNISR
jgi:hypothetical protein